MNSSGCALVRPARSQDNQLAMRTLLRTLLISVMVTGGLTQVLGFEKELPPAGNAHEYAIHEEHSDEKVTIAIDPYWSEEQQDYFKTHFRGYQLLPVRLIITNDGDQPISLRDLEIQFITARREKAEPSTVDDIERRIANPVKDTSKPPVQLPLPMPRKAPKRLKGGAAKEIDNLLFQAMAVEPHNTQSGFLVFDVLGMADPLAGTHIYIRGIKLQGKELFYFDLPLRKDAAPGS